MPQALLLCAIAGAYALPSCVGVESQCATDSDCCPSKGTDPIKCEKVNDYYSKCVLQPKCAAKGNQCAGKGNHPMEPIECCDSGWTCTAVDEVRARSWPNRVQSNGWSRHCAHAPCRALCDSLAAPWMGTFLSLPPVGQTFSHCTDGTPPPEPPAPPPPQCAKDGAQCAGKGGSAMPTLPCCTEGFSCVAVSDVRAPPTPTSSRRPHPPPLTEARASPPPRVQRLLHCFRLPLRLARCSSEQYYSHCVDGTPPPSPPAPPPQSCAKDGNQCDGQGFGPGKIDCCEEDSECVAVNTWFSKCLRKATTCAHDSAQCAGTGDHVYAPVRLWRLSERVSRTRARRVATMSCMDHVAW